MEELYENKTTYSKEEYKIFLEYHKKEYAVSEYGFIIFYLIFFVCCTAIAFREHQIALGVALTIGILIYIWYKFIRSAKRVEKDLNSDKLSGNFINTYKFYKKYFKVENPEGEAQLVYISLYRVIETKENYYIYISRDNAFIISKDGFTKGDEREFSKFIKSKAMIKYRNRIRK